MKLMLTLLKYLSDIQLFEIPSNIAYIEGDWDPDIFLFNRNI